MRTQLLCPVYRKWLQLHPEHAREERQALRKQACAYQRSGDLQKAFTFNQLVWEVAQSVLLALRPVDQYSAESQKDLVFFAASAIAVDRCARANCAETTTSTNATAQTVITDTQQQLAALMPMYASEPRLMHIIQELMHWLKLGATAKTPPVLH